METINTLAADARSNGRARTRDEWSLLLGRVNFETVLREGLFIGPSGVDTDGPIKRPSQIGRAHV